MKPDYYKIKIDDVEIANHITLEYVCIFLKAIFNEFFNEDTLSVTVERYEEADIVTPILPTNIAAEENGGKANDEHRHHADL